MVKALIAAAVLAASVPAQADLYSCQEKGRMVIRDQSCDHKGKLPRFLSPLDYLYFAPEAKPAPTLAEIWAAEERKRLEEREAAGAEGDRQSTP